MNELLVLVHTADNKIYIPAVLDGMTIETSRKGQPGKLSFKAVQDDLLTIAEGNIVQVKRGDTGILQGIVFSRALDKDNICLLYTSHRKALPATLGKRSAF